jgi:hypothetical protein
VYYGFVIPKNKCVKKKKNKAWNGRGQFWLDLNGLDWQLLVLACLEWLGMSEVDFGPTGTSWNRGSCFWHDWNGLE